MNHTMIHKYREVFGLVVCFGCSVLLPGLLPAYNEG